jgi:hypothetical protein
MLMARQRIRYASNLAASEDDEWDLPIPNTGMTIRELWCTREQRRQRQTIMEESSESDDSSVTSLFEYEEKMESKMYSAHMVQLYRRIYPVLVYLVYLGLHNVEVHDELKDCSRHELLIYQQIRILYRVALQDVQR